MKNLQKIFLICFSICFLISCGSSGKKQTGKTEDVKTNPEVKEKPSGFQDLISTVFKIDTYEDQRILESGMGFFIANDIVVTRLSFFESANRAVIEPFDETKSYEVSGYVNVDRINDLILLKVEDLERKPLTLSNEVCNDMEKTIYFNKPQGGVIPTHAGKILSYSGMFGSKVYRVSNLLRSKSAGSPMFNSDMQCIGLTFMQVADYETQTFVTPSFFIADLLKTAGKVIPLSQLNGKLNEAESQVNSKIKGLVIETDMGNIKIKLYNSTPQYRENFLKLVRENYYDGLLIHRVIKGFCIQSGAADTRYCESGDAVGWKGPGYTLPAHFVPGQFHKRGVIGSPRKPDRGNSRKRSDGSQFYIVTGRTYTDQELNDFEKQLDHKYTAEQRHIYKTIGGAPHIDGTFTIFGEVTEGMDIADQISNVEVSTEFRPKTDIRLKKIRILE